MGMSPIKENISLAPFTTFRAGGAARYFVEVTDVEEILPIFHFIKKHKLPVFVLGGGSNILVDDRGYAGLVLKMNMLGIEFHNEGEYCFVTTGAGVAWDKLVECAVSAECFGIENLSLIPGTVGGAIVQNIGAYGCEVEEVVEWVEVYDAMQERLRRLTKAECKFAYRESVFKHEGKGLVVTRVQFRLRTHGKLNISYKDLAAYFSHANIITPTVHGVRRAVIAIRTLKFPLLATHGTAGSFFKNPIVTKAMGEKFLTQFKDATHYDAGDGCMKLSAAWIIDNILHMRGVREGNVGCWNAQALVIVNYGGATSDEIKILSARYKKNVLMRRTSYSNVK